VSRIAVTGSVANDYLMTFDGRFAEQIVPEAIQRLSLSFLVGELDVRRGGVAANISYGLAQLGLRPVLVASVGHDFADYRSWLDRHGVDTSAIRESELRYTARFFCTTDLDNNQIASFYTGAMHEARELELAPIAARLGALDLVVISPNDPVAMFRHTAECRATGVAFVADPSQQLTSLDGEEIATLVEGAAYLVANDYEMALIESKTGWTHGQTLDKVEVCVTTLGADGALVESAGASVRVPVVPEERQADPTGVGDAFRAGFLAGRSWGLELERSAQLGSLLATTVLETVGPQEYEIEPAPFLARLRSAFGDDAAADVAPHLRPAAAGA
jgi:adenosine kinase